MKKVINMIAVLLLAVISTSCLESNLDDLDTYKGNDITGVVGVYHRYYGTEVIPGSGEHKVLQVTLSSSNFQANEEAGTCQFDFKLPSNFPEAQKSEFTPSNIAVILSISSASICKPVEGAPTLGAPGDWSKPNKYEITAANGDKKVWTVTANFLE